MAGLMLGKGRNEAWIYAKGGQRPIAPVENSSGLEWNRVLNDVSSASLKVATGTHGDCCSIYGRIGTWGHELVVFRDGKRVWEGPITNIKWRRGGVDIVAQDVLAWTRRTPVRDILDTAPVKVVTAASYDLLQTFFGHNPNVFDHISLRDEANSPEVIRDVLPNSGYIYEQLTELAKAGLMFTTVGRSIVVWHAGYVVGRTQPLIPALHTSGDVEVEEDGMMVAPRVIFTNDEGESGIAGPEVDPFYGALTTLVSSEGFGDTLNTMASTYRDQHYPAPVSVTVPQGSVLDGHSPFPIETLVAGTVVPVKVESGLCRTVDSTQILSGVKVTADGGEKVAVDLKPISSLAVEEE